MSLDENNRLRACSFSDRSRKEADGALKRTIQPNHSVIRGGSPAERRVLRDLQRLYMGKGKVNLNSIDLSHVSAFGKRVYLILHKIPRGRVTTYGAIASKFGSRRYARAVGTAVASNPLPLVIPCHRVVPSSLLIENYGLGGRAPSEGAYMKRRLLEREGVRFRGNRVSKECLWFPN